MRRWLVLWRWLALWGQPADRRGRIARTLPCVLRALSDRLTGPRKVIIIARALRVLLLGRRDQRRETTTKA